MILSNANHGTWSYQSYNPTPVSPVCQAYQLKLLDIIYYNFKVDPNKSQKGVDIASQ